jgi:hypothetical protein
MAALAAKRIRTATSIPISCPVIFRTDSDMDEGEILVSLTRVRYRVVTVPHSWQVGPVLRVVA